MPTQLKENANGIRYPRIEYNNGHHLSQFSNKRTDGEIDLVSLIGKSVDVYQKRRKEINKTLIYCFVIVFTVILLFYFKTILNSVANKGVYVSNLTAITTLFPSNQIEKVIYNLKIHIKNNDLEALSSALNISSIEAKSIKDIQVSNNDELIYGNASLYVSKEQKRRKKEKENPFFYIKLKTNNAAYLKNYEKAIMSYINTRTFIKNKLSTINKSVNTTEGIISVLETEIIALDVKEKKYAYMGNNRGSGNVLAEIFRERSEKKQILQNEQKYLTTLQKERKGSPRVITGFDSAERERLTAKSPMRLLLNLFLFAAVFTCFFTTGKIIVQESIETYALRK